MKKKSLPKKCRLQSLEAKYKAHFFVYLRVDYTL